MLVLSVYFLFQVLAVYGLGLLFHKAVRFSSVSTGEIGLFGIVLSISIASCWSLFLPLSYLGYALLGVGVISTLLLGKKNFSFVNIALFLALLFPLYISVPQYDTGLYHLSQIIFERDFALPFGLANLHSRLGFNSVWLTYSAAMGLGSDWIASSFLVNASLFYFLLLFVLDELKSTKLFSISNSLIFLTAVLLSQLNRPFDLGGPNTDFPSQIFGILGIFSFIMYLSSKKADSLEKSILFSIVSVVLKFSNFGFVLIPVFFGIFKLKRQLLRSKVAILSIVLVVVWVVRSTILTGCLISVIPVSCMPLEWSAQLQMEFATEWIAAWSKYPGEDAEVINADFSWISSYWLNYIMSLKIVRFLVSLILMSLFKLILLKDRSKKALSEYSWMLYSLCLGFSVWFFSAPDYRFVQFYVVFLCGILLSYLLQSLRQFINIISRPAFLVVILYFLGVGVVRMVKYREQLNDPWPRFSTPQYSTYQTSNDKYKINVPDGTDQCFDIPFCTPEYSENISIEKKWDRLFITRK